MIKVNIVLTEGQIEHIINGGVVTIELPDDGEVTVRQSLLKDIIAPIINNPMKVVNVHAEERKRQFMNDAFKAGR